MDSGRPPRLRRKSSAFKLSLSRASQASAFAQAISHSPLPAYPRTPGTSEFDRDSNATDYPNWVPPSPAPTSASSSTQYFEPPSPAVPFDNMQGSTSTVAASFPNVPSPSLSSTLEMLKGIVQKRITAWTYLRNAGQGKVYWFNTVLLTKEDMRRAFPNDKMRSRSTRFAILGMSLSSILEISPAHDFLRGLLSLVQEFEAIPEDKFAALISSGPNGGGGGGVGAAGANGIGIGSGIGTGGSAGGAGGGGAGGGTGGGGSGKGGQKSLFKLSSNKSRKPTAGSGISNSGTIHLEGSSASMSGFGSTSSSASMTGSGTGGGNGAEFAFGEASESGYLFIPNIPFELDYFQSLTTTCELLIEVYTKIFSYLGGGTATPGGSMSVLGSMFDPASISQSSFKTGATSSSIMTPNTTTAALSQSLAEVVLKIDARLKKLVGSLSKDIDTLARTAIKNELEVLGGAVEGWGGGGGGGSGGTSSFEQQLHGSSLLVGQES
ncbi:uncharacterized protein JCM15063_002207 [Sporobolomyces koalae]|uniref:uncharacterized protein n=1 Tax=Sporobolomyces koalae TaxID=500713 RepID=UPI0031807A20